MERHTITEQKLNEWLCRPQWQLYANSGSMKSNKRFEVDASEDGCVFRVTDHGDVVFLGADKAAAILAYNNLP